MTNVNVAGEDITGMVVVGTRGAKATGTMTFEGGMKPDGLTTIAHQCDAGRRRRQPDARAWAARP